MTTRQQWLLVASIVSVIALGLVAATRLMRDELFPITIGSTAPNFRAKVLGANRYKSLEDYKGKVVLLNLWATWCEPCLREMPSIERLHQAYGDKGLSVVSVSVDAYANDDSVRAFARNLGVTFEILRDSTMRISDTYQSTGYPETFVIDPERTIRKRWIGAADWSSPGNRALVAQLLGLETPRVVLETRSGPR
jgi:cytochrome c biogenesis protein CcmG/thiol:disulfide interchange protein DsbE